MRFTILTAFLLGSAAVLAAPIGTIDSGPVEIIQRGQCLSCTGRNNPAFNLNNNIPMRPQRPAPQRRPPSAQRHSSAARPPNAQQRPRPRPQRTSSFASHGRPNVGLRPPSPAHHPRGRPPQRSHGRGRAQAGRGSRN